MRQHAGATVKRKRMKMNEEKNITQAHDATKRLPCCFCSQRRAERPKGTHGCCGVIRPKKKKMCNQTLISNHKQQQPCEILRARTNEMPPQTPNEIKCTLFGCEKQANEILQYLNGPAAQCPEWVLKFQFAICCVNRSWNSMCVRIYLYILMVCPSWCQYGEHFSMYRSVLSDPEELVLVDLADGKYSLPVSPPFLLSRWTVSDISTSTPLRTAQHI